MIKKRGPFIIYSFFYIVVLTIALGVLYNFKPYSYVNNEKSYILCKKNNMTYEVGWNFIYSFDRKLDSFNDVKARKLCEYGSIKDYGNTLKTPTTVNYQFHPVLIQESNWADAIVMFFASLIIGMLFIETMRILFHTIHKEKTYSYFFDRRSFAQFFLITIIFASILFLILLHKPAAMVYCKRQVARKVNSFKRIIFKYGVFPIPEEDININTHLIPLYKQCMMKEMGTY